MIVTAEGYKFEELQEDLMPVKIVDSYKVENVENLLLSNAACVTFQSTNWASFQECGSYVVLDFGKELCGGVRIITQTSEGCGKWRLTFGESLSEACSTLGEKNATNDHSPRDYIVTSSPMSDLQYGQTGFRFVKVELLEAAPAVIQNIFAVSHLPLFEQEAEIKTNDAMLNDIIKTAVYTLKLSFQNGYIWDGIKRDRLVWSGDLHPEIVTSLYMFGDNDNTKNSLVFLRKSTPKNQWINQLPSYSAWWVINLCDYCTITGNWDFFEENKEYALEIIEHFNKCLKDTGEVILEGEDFLDLSTKDHPEAIVGVLSLIRWMAQKYRMIEENESCQRLIDGLAGWVDKKTTKKPVRAFQILAGRSFSEEDADMLQEENAQGFSTFMAYYILTATAIVGGTNMLSVLKEYYGSMLSRGATSFWEDFDMRWLGNSGRIDQLPQEGQKDIHGDFGQFCAKQFRRSLCHGWASGVVAFLVEYILGVRIINGGKTISVKPHLMGLADVEAKIPMKNGNLVINIHGDDIQISAPNDTIFI